MSGSTAFASDSSLGAGSNCPRNALSAMPTVVGNERLKQTVLRLQGLEAAAAVACQHHMARLRAEHLAWFSEFEDTDPDTAELEEVLALVLSAPNPFASGLMYGKFTIRMAIAAVTGRSS